MLTLDQIKEEVKSNVGRKAKVVFNGTRNRVEKYDAVIVETYPFVFVMELIDDNQSVEKKSFSYSDVLTNTIELDFGDKKKEE